MRQEIRYATAYKTNLGIEDHGILSMNIDFDYNDSSFQGIGCYGISGLMAEKSIKSFLKLFDVNYWENIPGKKCQVRCDNGMIRAIRLKNDDDWTELKEVFSEDEPMKAFRLLGDIDKHN